MLHVQAIFFDTRRADQGGAAAAGGGQEGDVVAREEDKLYGEWQTSVWTPPPVGLDGKVPKNEYGTWGLPNARHLPAGAVHLNMPGVAKAAKKLGIDFAKAVTSFEFKNGRNLPVEDGIITAAGNVWPHLGYKCASKKSAHIYRWKVPMTAFTVQIVCQTWGAALPWNIRGDPFAACFA